MPPNGQGSSATDLKQRVQELVQRVRNQPNNEVPLLQLGQAYIQLWMKTKQSDLPARITRCLKRAVALENGRYAKQVGQLLDVMNKQAEKQGLSDVTNEIVQLRKKLDAKTASRKKAAAEESTAAPKAAEPPAAPAKETPETKTEAAKAETPKADEQQPEPEATGQEQEPEEPEPAEEKEEELEEGVVPQPRIPTADIQRAAEREPQAPPEEEGEKEREAEAEGEEPEEEEEIGVPTIEPGETTATWTPPEPAEEEPEEPAEEEGPGIDMEITTVPEETPEEETSSHGPAHLSAEERQGMSREVAAGAAESLRRMQALFQDEDIEAILEGYANEAESRVRRRIADMLIQKIGDWGIEPVLAATAMESDEQIFRMVMRRLLKRDRKDICNRIEPDNYSPDLKRVAVTVLSELSVPSAIPKLQKCLQSRDPIVRSVAAHGIGRAARGGGPAIRILVEVVRSDPNAQVRLSAAKAIQSLHLREAYDALEALAGSARLDAKVYEMLEDMRDEFGTKQAAGQQKAPGSEKLSEEQAKKRKQIIGLVVVFAILGAFLVWQYVLK